MHDQFYMALLTGSKEVPPVQSNADGIALFHLDKRRNQIRFRLDVAGIDFISEANIHLGRRNIIGPKVAILPNPTNSDVMEGYITSEILQGPLEGKSISDLAHEIETGKAFVQIQSKRKPNGELRGKIMQN
ncbi:CHRD domain-containing protein [Oceanobacillus senegalensis]|uniref:CHRD domain-containing protein n=1 Tax=Oceanobacillus senegalensis TaxID=1936063 RepID=UPI000A305511|nr:CHRD domain-containing protein [Oceanobacillus senegalensis]